MTREYVVGLFQSKGTAEDAVHRLQTEGVPGGLISLVVLHEWALAQSVSSPVDPLLVGDVRNTFAPYIKNGETAIFVEVATGADIEQAVDTVRQYAPIKIGIVVAGEFALVDHDVP